MPCCLTNGLGGLGQVDPATIAAVQQAVVHAKDLWNDIQRIFGIGAGHHEADAIVPLQNQITNNVLVPVGAFLEATRTGADTSGTCTQFQTDLAQVKAAQTQWLTFLHNTQWQDGRAAAQAESDLKPIFDSQITELTKFVSQKCGVSGLPGGGIITNPDGSTNWPIIAMGAGLVYMLTRRK